MVKLKKKRSLRQNTELYNYYYKKTGFYKTLILSVLKLTIGIALLIAALFVLSEFLFEDLENTFVMLSDKVPQIVVYLMFFLSDSVFLSLVPPDLFILWADSFDNGFMVLLLLGLISYCAGVFSYYLGSKIARFPKVNKWLHKRFPGLFRSVNKWGGAFIIIAAVLPIPWSPALIVTGMLGYPFVKMLYFAITRFARFVLYGLVLFNVVDVF